MPSKPALTCVGVVLAALSIAALPGLAQTHRADYEAESMLSTAGAAPGLGAAVLNAPFSAEATTTWFPKEPNQRSVWRSNLKFYRDREGRVRVEQTFVDHSDVLSPQRIVITSDPNGHTAFVIDTTARTISEDPRPIAGHTVGGYGRLVLPLSMGRFIIFERPQLWRAYSNAAGEDASLGQATILDVPANGSRADITLPAGSFRVDHQIQIADERWISTELQLLMYSRTEDSEYGTLEHRVTRITLDDPPAELFEIPTGYQPVASHYSFGFLNPYIPLREGWAWSDRRVPFEED